MKITQEQYQLIADAFPKQRGNVKVSNLDALNALLHILEQGCKWRALPKEFGNWHTIYMRFSRWSHNGVLARVFQRLQQEQIINLEVLGLDSTTIKVHPDAAGAPTTRGPQAIGRSRGGLTTKLHMIASDARTAIIYAISPGQDHDAPHGRKLLEKLGARKKEPEGEQLKLFLVADRAYEGDETRELAVALGYTPVIPPRSNRRHRWDYDQHIYKRRNRSRAALLPDQSLPACLRPLRQTRRHLPSIHHPRPHPRHPQKREHALVAQLVIMASDARSVISRSGCHSDRASETPGGPSRSEPGSM